jgi:hypothetical protein
MRLNGLVLRRDRRDDMVDIDFFDSSSNLDCLVDSAPVRSVAGRYALVTVFSASIA